jgi:hypothetical protein
MQTSRFGLLPIGSANVATWWKVAVLIPKLEDADCTIGPDRQRRQYDTTNESHP